MYINQLLFLLNGFLEFLGGDAFRIIFIPLIRETRVFPRPFTHGGFVPPPYGGGTSAGGQSIDGGTHEGDIDLMGGPNFDRLYHKLKVLLMLSCNYTMQFIGYDSIKTSLIYILSLSNSHNDTASMQKNRDDESHYVNVALLILL